MKRILAVVLVVLVWGLQGQAVAGGWIAQAVSPDGQHGLYSDGEQVFLVDHGNGTAITLDLPGIYAITWMDNKSALLNRGTHDLFIVDLKGGIFYMECYRNNNPDRGCALTPEY